MKLKHLLVVGLLLTTAFWVQPVQAQEDVVSIEIADDVSAAAIEEYWTDERMKNAIPYPMYSPEGPAIDIMTSDISINPADGEPGFSPGGLPGFKGSFPTGDSGTSEPALSDDEIGNILHDTGPHGYHMPFPFTMYEVHSRDIRKYPYGAIGRIFFVTATGNNSTCSGSSIGGKAVLTAGHCVSDGAGNWHDKWIFRPAYRDSGGKRTSLESWTANTAITYLSWHEQGNFCRDIAWLITKKKKVKVGNKKKKRSLSQYVGWLGHAWNWDAQHQHWTAFGYPADPSNTDPNFNFKGRRMFENHASFAEYTAEWWDLDCKPEPFCFGSYMTGGASGGPVIFRFDPTGGKYPGGELGGNYANGVNSTYYLSGRVAGGLCSPYFDTDVHDKIVEYQQR